MGQYKDGSWRLRNLIIETINLGEIYRNQFVALAKEANEDLDLVIAQWNDIFRNRQRSWRVTEQDLINLLEASFLMRRYRLTRWSHVDITVVAAG